jgi:trehalose synthase
MVHDPQPAALLQVLEEEGGREGSWLWRCHIDLSAPYRPVWDLFEPIVNRFDAAIFTAREYVQPGIAGPELAFIPPSIDPLSPKNAPMAERAWRDVLASYGIDPERPLLVQVSRFDPWKDPTGVIDAWRLVRREVEDVQLVMVGSLAHDDPEGMRYLDLTAEHAGGEPDVHLLTDLDGVGDVAVNAFQRAADVVVQKSLREGFGLVVAEGMWKGKPVIGGDVGGIRLQIREGVDGHLVDSVPSCADRIIELLADPERRRVMGEAGRERVRERFLSLREIEDTLGLIEKLR